MNQKITYGSDLAGKTIRICIQDMDGHGLVLVFEDNTWCALKAEEGHFKPASVAISSATYGTDDITNHLTALDLLNAELISKPQYEFMVSEQKGKEAEKKRAHAQRLIDEADALDQSKND